MTAITDDSLVTELTNALKIDKAGLDDCLIHHAELYWHASELLSRWSERRDATKLKIKSLEATLDEQIRETASAAGEKITDKATERAIARDSTTVELQKRLLQEATMTAKLEKLVDAFTERRHMLNKLVDLYTSNYWSTPSGTATSAVKAQTAARARGELAQRRRQASKQGDTDGE